MSEARHEWIGGVAADHEAMENVDLEFWLALSPEDRMGLVWELSSSFDWTDDDEAGPGIHGPDRGVRAVGR